MPNKKRNYINLHFFTFRVVIIRFPYVSIPKDLHQLFEWLKCDTKNFTTKSKKKVNWIYFFDVVITSKSLYDIVNH